MAKKGISILGSTGSIGRQTLDVISSFPGKFNIVGFSAKGNLELLEDQIKKFSPKIACVEKEEDARKLVSRLGKTTTIIYFGEEGLNKVSCHKKTDILVAAIPGSQALKPTISAIERGKSIALASKEILVAAGELVMKLASKTNSKILPIDSEHSAIAQCLKGEKEKDIKRIILTASGGPFHDMSKEDLKKVTPEIALAHPTWNMGKKISIDSATLMNKGLEVIEAHHLFNVPYSKIEVLIHPQSIVHSMVEFSDGSVIAQLGAPDMRIPIQYALLNFHRVENIFPKLDLAETSALTFKKVDSDKFPCLKLAYSVGNRGGILPAVLGAADEAAVSLFLNGKIKFTEIHEVIESAVRKHQNISDPTLEEIIEADKSAKQLILDNKAT